MDLAHLVTANRYHVSAIAINPNSVIPLTISDLVVVQDRELSPGIAVSIPLGVNPGQLFFLPDGRITDSWSPGLNPLPMLPMTFDFSYGTASMGVTISGFGGISSTEFYED
jgi:hypothetical protein